MLRLKHETELEVTILSGNEFQILTIRLVKKFLSRKEPTGSLANLNEFPRVEEYVARTRKHEQFISTRPFNIL